MKKKNSKKSAFVHITDKAKNTVFKNCEFHDGGTGRPFMHNEGKNTKVEGTKFFSLNNAKQHPGWISALLIAVLTMGSSPWWWPWKEVTPAQAISESPCSINTIDQSGGQNTVNCDTDPSLKEDVKNMLPRSLTEEQRAKLLDAASKRRARIGFASKLFDGESEDFADDLSSVFSDAGWQIEQKIKNSTNDLKDFVTVAATYSQEVSLSELSGLIEFVCSTLNQVDVPCKIVSIPENTYTFNEGPPSPDTIYVFVGRKGSQN